MNFISNISIKMRVVMIFISLSLPILYLGYLYADYSMTRIDNRKLEVNGLQYEKYLRPLLLYIAQHRGLTAAYFSGKQDLIDKINTVEIKVDQAIHDLKLFDQDWAEVFSTEPLLTKIINEWLYIKDNNLQFGKQENFTLHSILISELIAYFEHIVIESRLYLDQDMDISHLVEMALKDLPVLVEELGKLRSITTGIAARQSLEDGDRAKVISYQISADNALRAFESSTQRAMSSNPQINQLFSSRLDNIVTASSAFIKRTELLLRDSAVLAKADADEHFNAGTRAISLIDEIYNIALPKMQAYLDERIEAMENQSQLAIGIACVLFFMACILNLMVSHDMRISFDKIHRYFSNIENSQYDNDIDTSGNNELSKIFKGLAAMQSGLKKSSQRDRKLARDNGRIKQALDNVASSVMVTDANMDIIYLNQAAIAMFKAAQNSIKTGIKDFDANNLIARNIVYFDINADRILPDADNHYHGIEKRVDLGAHSFMVIVSAVLDENNEKIGSVLEWKDRTQELAVEKEVQDLVNNALHGDLSSRVELNGKEGFYKFLSEGINNLIDVSEGVINDTIRVLSALSHGDLTEKINSEYQGAFEKLKTDANKTIAKLTTIVSQIKESSSLVTLASDEISRGSSTLSERTESQAGCLQQTTSNMAIMTTTVQKNAASAARANTLAIRAREQAVAGGNVVNSAVSSMQKINQSSNKIAGIIGVIDEIAFKTNLLALNAAVEAARAGEQGRGFAVVASEVRNLAGRSATAAREIKALIQDSISKVEEGSHLVNQSGKTLNSIMSSVESVADIIGNIAAASQAQTRGIEEVNKAVAGMEQVTQQNAVLVEQASASAQSMHQQSNNLNALVEFFKVNENAAPSEFVERRAGSRPWSGAARGSEHDAMRAPNDFDHTSDDDCTQPAWQEF